MININDINRITGASYTIRMCSLNVSSDFKFIVEIQIFV